MAWGRPAGGCCWSPGRQSLQQAPSTKPCSLGSSGAFPAQANGSREQQAGQQRVKSLRWDLVSCFLPLTIIEQREQGWTGLCRAR